MSAPTQSQDFFIYRERNGTPVVVDTLSRVPEHGKKSLRIVTLRHQTNDEPFLDPAFLEKVLTAPKDAVNQGVTRAKEAGEKVGIVHLPDRIEPTSILLGTAAGFAIGVIAARIFRAPGWVIKIGLLMVATTLCGGLYYGWVRAQLSVGDSETIVHPGILIDDARRAAEAVRQRQAEDKKTLEQLD